jgi:hypothetical protein
LTLASVGHLGLTGHTPIVTASPVAPAQQQTFRYRAARISGNLGYTATLWEAVVTGTAAATLDGVTGQALQGASGAKTLVPADMGHLALAGYTPIVVRGENYVSPEKGVFYRPVYNNGNLVYAPAWLGYGNYAVSAATLDGVQASGYATVQEISVGASGVVYKPARNGGNLVYSANRINQGALPSGWTQDPQEFAAVGYASVEGSGAGTLRPHKLVAAGRVTDGSIVCAGNAALAGVTGAAVGLSASIGTGTGALRPHKLTASGRVSGSGIVGAGAATLDGVAGVAKGNYTVGVASATLDGVVGAAVGHSPVDGVAAATLTDVTGAARGYAVTGGSGSVPPFVLTVTINEWLLTCSLIDMSCSGTTTTEFVLNGDTDEFVVSGE